ncbi:beta strand repeat-containing protein [Burkholderia cenocepacia]|uniref:beta strand repeat-containing protein n=1 Tax=Burkholderia cenocepacia TaxID=95486 RepID=UPI000761AFFD|nr:choice-of-anchor D domain-containing protein [Burkholderia cenocepacia]KWU26328.1 hypothetical protein AS149_25400 [Burkholderia cenocepacia]
MAKTLKAFRLSAAALAAFCVLAPPGQAATSMTMQFRVPAASLAVVETKGLAVVGPAALDFGQQQPNTTSEGRAATLKNTGTSSLSVASITATGPFTLSQNCPAALSPGNSCTTDVFFSPTGLGAAQGALTIATDGGTATVRLSGVGAEYTADVTPALLDFGDGTVDATSAAKQVNLANAGNLPLAVTGARITSGPFVLSQDNCGSSVAGGASCTYGVSFTPTAMGDVAGSFMVQTPAGNRSVTLHGFGRQSSQNLTVGSLSFDPTPVGTTSSAQGVSLSNTGNTPLTVGAITSTGPFAVAQNCPSTLDGGASCLASVTFKPVQMGDAAGSLVFNTTLGARTVTLSGIGQQALLAATPTSLAFGNQAVGSASADESVTLTNTGNADGSVGSATVSAPFALDSTTCASSLAAGASCAFQVKFNPTVMGVASGTMTIPTASGDQTVSLTGLGQQANVRANPTSVDFSGQPVGSTSATKTVTLTNTGNIDASVGSADVSAPFAVDSTTCASTLAAGASCDIKVKFSPTVMGAASGPLSVPTASGTQVIALSGLGQQAKVAANPTALDFGGQAVGSTSSTQTVTLANSGNIATSVGTPTVSAQFALDSTTCASSLAAGASCMVIVKYSPTVAGTSTGTLTVPTGAGAQTIALNGLGQQASVAATPSSLSFGTQAVGSTSAAQTVTLTNSGNISSTIGAPSVAAPFALQWTTCASTLAAGANCTMSVKFSPTAMGTSNSTLAVSTASGVQSVAVTGTGVQTVLSANPTSLAYGNVQTGQSSVQTFTLVNSGNLAASGLSITAPSGYQQTNNCGTSLAGGANCTVNVTFAPTAVQPYSGSVSVTSSTASTSVAVSGSSVGPAMAVSPATISFGGVNVGTTSAAQTVTVKNAGVGPLTVTGFALAANSSLSADTCTNKTIPVGGSCTANLAITPPSTNSYSGTVTVSASGVTASKAVVLQGYGKQNDALIAPVGAVASGERNTAWIATGYQYIWNAAGYSNAVPAGYVHFETLLTNNSSSPISVYVNASIDDQVTGVKLAGVSQATGCLASNGFSSVCKAGPYTIAPGTTRLDIQVLNGATAANPAGLSAWVTDSAGNVLSSTSSGFYWTGTGF